MTIPAASVIAPDDVPCVIGGVDTHKRTHHAAAINEHGPLLGDHEFPANQEGYQDLRDWLRGFGNVAVIGVESTGSFGASLANTVCKWASNWLPTAIRAATRSRRARTLARSVVVAEESNTIGRSRCASVRTTSASTYASNRSSLFPAEPYRERRFFTCPGGMTYNLSPARRSAATNGPSPLDPDLVRACPSEPATGLLQSSGIMRHGEPVDHLSLFTDHAHHMVVLRPVHARGHTNGGRLGDTHRRLLAVCPVGRHPVVPGHHCRSLTDRRSLAHSPVASRGCPGPPGLAELMLDLEDRADVGDDPAGTRVRRNPLTQRPDKRIRHNESGPVSGSWFFRF